MLVLPVFSPAEEQLGVFKVGVAKRDITPREPVPMWGYGARHAALSTGILDPLYAAALVIQAGTNKLAIVGLDLGRAPAERSLQIIRNRIKTEAGIEYSFIAGSHTHHGPVLELTDEAGKGKGKYDAALRYYKEMEDGIAEAIIEANGLSISTVTAIRRSSQNPVTVTSASCALMMRPVSPWLSLSTLPPIPRRSRRRR